MATTGRIQNTEQEVTEATERQRFLCCLCFLLFELRAKQQSEKKQNDPNHAIDLARVIHGFVGRTEQLVILPELQSLVKR
jgi:hypothetical protein